MNVPQSEINNMNNINNVNNTDVISKTLTTDVIIKQHNLKESVIPLNLPQPDKPKKAEEENGTVLTQVQLLEDKKENKDALYELNKSLEKTDDSSKNSTKGSEDPKESTQQNESFLQKTKRWAGNVWSYVNVANYFPKAEFKEYRNANGDWVKIPVKKIPLKKKKVELTDEEYSVSRTYERDSVNLANLTGERMAIPNLF